MANPCNCPLVDGILRPESCALSPPVLVALDWCCANFKLLSGRLQEITFKTLMMSKPCALDKTVRHAHRPPRPLQGFCAVCVPHVDQ